MPPKSKADGAKKSRAPAKRKLAEEFPPGEVLMDNAKKKWKLGSAAGQGGFGLLYLGRIQKSCRKLSSNALFCFIYQLLKCKFVIYILANANLSYIF
uniref:Uncharacterized protein n=1 Tax=Sinocyclocheilus anshuiensis TaxID=1608454 RepID=A0A671MDT2_9TELE